MQENFDKSMPFVLVHEGGYADHPDDPGGATMKGVTQRVYDGWRRSKGLPTQSVRHITDDELFAIYRIQYWNKVWGDRLPPGVDYFVLDGAIHSGPSQSIKWLQRSLGSLYTGEVDGVLGEATMDAVRKYLDHDALIADMASRRMAMLKGLKNWRSFGKGWTRRVAEAKAHGQAMASGSVGPAPTEVWRDGGAVKAEAQDLKKPTLPISVPTGAAGGGMGTVAMIESAKSTIEPLTVSSPWVAQVFVGLTVLGVAITIGGIAYGKWAADRNKRNKDLADGILKADVPRLSEL